MSFSCPITVPEILPVMLLRSCTLFPHSLLPLYIFEPRYRKMLAHALENHRMFCVGNLKYCLDGSDDDEADELISPVTTAGMVRACVGQPDGTSHLMLQGVGRIRIVNWEQRTPFRLARVELLPSVVGSKQDNLISAGHLTQRVFRLLKDCGHGSDQVCSQLKNLENPDMLADFVAANFLSDPCSRQQALEIADVGERIRFLLEKLSVPGDSEKKFI